MLTMQESLIGKGDKVLQDQEGLGQLETVLRPFVGELVEMLVNVSERQFAAAIRQGMTEEQAIVAVRKYLLLLIAASRGE